MFSAMLEVNPKAGQFDAYFGMATMLRPELEAIEGFVDNARFSSLQHEGWLLSLSTWRDEKALVRWRVKMNHHKTMQAARDRVVADYRMSIGETVTDTRIPAGYALSEQRLDETETGEGKAVTLLDGKYPADQVKQAGAEAVAKWLGLDTAAPGLLRWDTYDAIATPGDVITVAKWTDLDSAKNFERDAKLPDGVRLRHVRIVRSYGMFDRRETTQYFAEIKPNA
jgi:heme-degrading monooxygenase HmoA